MELNWENTPRTEITYSEELHFFQFIHFVYIVYKYQIWICRPILFKLKPRVSRYHELTYKKDSK